MTEGASPCTESIAVWISAVSLPVPALTHTRRSCGISAATFGKGWVPPPSAH
jgi:hypothetical protein